MTNIQTTDGTGLDPALHAFLGTGLPTLLARLRRWKGIDPRLHPELTEDLRQELVLDWLEHKEELQHLDPAQREGRWLRLLQRRHYDWHLRAGRRRHIDCEPDELGGGEGLVASPGTTIPELPPASRRLLEHLVARGVHLKNGRLNTSRTAAALGLCPEDLQHLLAQMLDRLDRGQEFVAFWTQRLVEALVGLAADLLRDHELVSLHDAAARARPDPRARFRRIRAIRRHLDGFHLPFPLRLVLARWTRRAAWKVLAPSPLLEDAALLAPESATVHLWRFEALAARAEFPAAARALRRARECGAERVPVALARARLAELRDKETLARRILARALTRHPREPRLRASFVALSAPANSA